jgi:hypothetical protein
VSFLFNQKAAGGNPGLQIKVGPRDGLERRGRGGLANWASRVLGGCLALGAVLSLVACAKGSGRNGGELSLASSELARGARYVVTAVPPHVDPPSFVRNWARGVRFTEDLKDREPSAFRAVERALLLRYFFEVAAHDELRRTPMTPAEATQAEEKNWQLVAQPRAVRAAEVYLPVKFVESNELALKKFAQVRAAALTALSTEDLARKVQAASSEVKASTSARKLAPLSADGRVVVKSVGDDPKFVLGAGLAQAVASLERAGDVSEIVGSAGGYHFFYAIEVWQEVPLPNDAREAALTPLVAATRLTRSTAALRQSLRSGTKIVRNPNSGSLLERIGRND